MQFHNNKLIFSGQVITLTHAETGGALCFDEMSYKKPGCPIFARIFKGFDDSDKITTNCLFSIEIHDSVYKKVKSN